MTTFECDKAVRKKIADKVTLSVKVYTRDAALTRLLKSAAASGIKRVAVADDGPARSREWRNADWSFDLNYVDLPTDAGVGPARNRIAREAETELLLYVDPDHTIPCDWPVLCRQLGQRDDLAVVGGLLYEDGVGGHAWRFDSQGETLRRTDGQSTIEIQTVAGRPLITGYHQIPNAAAMRTDVVAGLWDEDARFSGVADHFAFYLSLYQLDRAIGLSPSVLFPHHDDPYSETTRRERVDPSAARRLLREEFGYDRIVTQDSALAANTRQGGISGALVGVTNNPYLIQAGRWADRHIERVKRIL